jgi:hypothetical protein
MPGTIFAKKCEILSELWLNHKDDEVFIDFVSYSDLALPLAYAIHNDIVAKTAEASKFINESFDLLLGIGGIDPDEQAFSDLDEVMEAGEFNSDDDEDE